MLNISALSSRVLITLFAAAVFALPSAAGFCGWGRGWCGRSGGRSRRGSSRRGRDRLGRDRRRGRASWDWRRRGARLDCRQWPEQRAIGDRNELDCHSRQDRDGDYVSAGNSDVEQSDKCLGQFCARYGGRCGNGSFHRRGWRRRNRNIWRNKWNRRHGHGRQSSGRSGNGGRQWQWRDIDRRRLNRSGWFAKRRTGGGPIQRCCFGQPRLCPRCRGGCSRIIWGIRAGNGEQHRLLTDR
jgi:hypothetical protein